MPQLSRLRLAVTVAAALAVGLAPAAASATPHADSLLSQGKPAAASSVENSTFPASNAVDGNAGTRWSSSFSDPQWISVDLGAIAQVDQVKLVWEAAYATAYQIQVSSDNLTWNSVYTTMAGKGGTETLTALAASGRYVRMLGTQRATQWGYSLFEFQVYGSLTSAASPTAPANLHSTAATDTSVALAWNPSTPGTGGAIKEYDVYQHGSQIATVPPSASTYTATGLTPNTQYFFTVFAKDVNGNVSPPSAEVPVKTMPSSDTTPPTAPGNLHVTGATANTVSLAWNASTDNVGVVGYDVYNGSSKAGSFTTTSGTIDGLAPSTNYTFTVKARDAAANVSAPSNAATATTTAGTGGGGTNPGQVTQITTDSDIPWGLTFLPDGTALISERDTFQIVHVTAGGQKTVVAKVPNATGTGGEGGLLGIAVAPTFTTDHWLYVMHTSPTDNRVVRFQYVNGTLGAEQVLLTGIARNLYHNGGRLAFGPDGKLYVTTGDAQNGANAQDLNSLNGKLLRLNPDGSVPSDNPFPGKYVWSYGHRNVQGIAWDSQGRLWESELGDSTQDEVNLIVKGGNYGWPICEGTHDHDGSCNNPNFIPPKRTFAPTGANSPSGLAIVGDVLFMSELTGQQMLRMPISGSSLPSQQAFFSGTYGRLRTVAPAPDGGLWLTTTNGDKNNTPGRLNNLILHVALTR
ncbi:glucose/arabinose dehydrogenase [Kutzneria buriramensis]|uniref:Glucose/arabinose dehydrogenase n=1 Tax=Kutzneria buriramensis TaxID=1045776 RepID=A0A3E0GXB1_9PSEU|nr:glucose/arabinose dehydrogenase [Kutzneria buriramensis]